MVQFCPVTVNTQLLLHEEQDMTKRSVIGVVLFLAGLSAACGTEGESSGTQAAQPEQPVQNGVSWERGIGALIAANCVSCHASGGVAPFALDTLEAVKAMGQVSLDSMEAGRMPPWQLDDDCRTYEEARRISDEDVALFREWVEAGMPGEAAEGDRPPPRSSTVVGREADVATQKPICPMQPSLMITVASS